MVERNIERNIVRIETIDGMGTGLIYPCSHENRKGYIIFTNRHVLENVFDVENIQEHVQITIYDDFGKEISNNKMKNWDYYCNKNGFKYQYKDEDDIAAIYLELYDDVVFHLETAVELNELDNRTSIFMEGYPGVMSDDSINKRIQLEGMSKSIFPSNEEIGVYQITDDYHWYSNYSDYAVLAGISGSPVYHKIKERNYILGINQSVSNIAQGENPFKLVYYIKFKHILDYLRREDCIIFSMISKCEFQILWIKGKKQERLQKRLNEIKLMLIGGSGAGKSSFVKSFAYHQNKIKSVGDGQTTRSDIIYSFSIDSINKNPNASVLFLTEEAFTNNMNVHIGSKPILLTFAQALGISTELVKDEKKFLILLHTIYEKFVQLEKEEKEKKGDCEKIFEDIEELLFYSETIENKIKQYQKILDHLLKLIPCYFMPCILDKNWVDEHFMVSNCSKEETPTLFGILKIQNTEYDEIWKILSKTVYDILKKNKDDFNKLQNNFVSLFYALYQLRNGNEKYLQEKENNLYNELKKITTQEMQQIPQILDVYSREEFQKRLKEPEFQEKLFYSLVCIEGFFDIKEFEFLLEKDCIEKIRKDNYLIEFEKSDDEQDETSKQEANNNIEEKKEIVISSRIKTILECIYNMIIEAIKKEYTKYTEKLKKDLYFDLNNMDKTDILNLQRCLKVTKEGSLTGIIQNVTIEDKISDLYAVILQKLEIDILTIVDTCGLDHVTIWDKTDLEKQVERLYEQYIKNWEVIGKEKKNCEVTKKEEKNYIRETAILYIKKLDSGKPDELNSILPVIRKMIPSTPIYCIFSGIDIFYRTEQEIDNILWKKNSENCPKAVRYILEDNINMQDIVDVNTYKVLKNNLIPFCGDEKLVHTKFAYYKNNVGAVRKLLTSIAMKESSSLEIIDQSFVDKIHNGEYDKEIEKIITTMFENASLHSRDRWHWKTQEADIISFFKNGELGFNRTYNHMLYYLFHNGFVDAIRDKWNILFEKTDKQAEEIKYKAAVVSSLYNMENLFLGINNNLVKTDLDDSEKNEFRQIIEKMYSQISYNQISCNPFSGDYEKDLTDENIKENRKELFDKVFEFSNHLNNKIKGDSTVLKELVDLFKKQFQKQIRIDNNRKVTYLVKMNESFMKGLDNIKKEFCEKYGDNNYEKEKMFETFMRYYFSSSNNNGNK